MRQLILISSRSRAPLSIGDTVYFDGRPTANAEARIAMIVPPRAGSLTDGARVYVRTEPTGFSPDIFDCEFREPLPYVFQSHDVLQALDETEQRFSRWLDVATLRTASDAELAALAVHTGKLHGQARVMRIARSIPGEARFPVRVRSFITE
jgi:hypothetical protein